MIKRTVAAISAALVLALGGTGAALASNGADDQPGHEHEHNHAHKGHHHHHHHGKGDNHGGKGQEPGGNSGGQTEAPQESTPPTGEYGY